MNLDPAPLGAHGRHRYKADRRPHGECICCRLPGIEVDDLWQLRPYPTLRQPLAQDALPVVAPFSIRTRTLFSSTTASSSSAIASLASSSGSGRSSVSSMLSLSHLNPSSLKSRSLTSTI